MNLVKLQDTKLIHRNIVHAYILAMRHQKEKLSKQSHLPPAKKKKNITAPPEAAHFIYGMLLLLEADTF